MKKAVCLFSGGLDSTTTLYVARQYGYEVLALTIHYGQWHACEIEAARVIARDLGIEHQVIELSLPWKGSALLDTDLLIPVGRSEAEMNQCIPPTYVPARNSIFLSMAASYAEARCAESLFIGVNAVDYSGYPDCRPEYLAAFDHVIRLGTKAGTEGKIIRIEAPLLMMSKKDIVLWGKELGVPFEKTWSCYQGGKTPCGECDSCQLRAKGFREAGIPDPLGVYAASGH